MSDTERKLKTPIEILTRERARRSKLREQGLCVWCMKPSESGDQYCDACKTRAREYRREQRKALKERGVCTRCGKRKSKPGRTVCRLCSQVEVERGRAYYKRFLAKNGAVGKHQYYLDHHMCTKCGKKLADDYKYVYCIRCKLKQHLHNGGGLPFVREHRCLYCKTKLNFSYQKKLCPECLGKFVRGELNDLARTK